MQHKPTVQQLVTFAILMENGAGIVNKSPDYILEKFNTALFCGDNQLLRGMLDMTNAVKFNQWLNRWMTHTK